MQLPRVILLLFSSFTTVSLATGSPKGYLFARTSLLCHITVECILSREVVVKLHRHFQCNPVDNNGLVSDFSYSVDLPSDFAQAHLSKIAAGSLFVTIPGGRIFKGAVHYPKDSAITVSPAPTPSESVRRRRELDSVGSTIGTRSVLVLRITAADVTNSYSAKELYSFIFNETLPITQPSLKSQFAKLSFGKLNFVPTKFGIMEVSISLNSTGGVAPIVRDAAIAVVLKQNGIASITELADFVMICLPPGTGTGTWASSATVGGWRTVYNDVWCGFISGQMHELGHNLGLLHSNIGSNQYLDFTSYMSAGFGTNYYPSKSFNGANNYQLGWYKDRLLTVDLSQGPQLVNLATFVDYLKSNKSNPVLIKLGNDTFLQYNRAKDFNYQAQQCIDQVTVVQQLFNGTNALGCIDPSAQPLTITNFGNSGQQLVISACSKGFGNTNDPDWMQLSIGFDKSYCGQQLTARPTTLKPTSLPTAKPTRVPTVFPTAKPTQVPTSQPTAKPTPQRTSLPSTTPFVVTTSSPSQQTPIPLPAAKLSPIRTTTKSTIAPAPMTTSPVLALTFQPLRMPTVAPSLVACYDSPSGPLFVSNVTRTCAWLRGHPSLQSQLCTQEAIQLACPRTCKTCQSACVDQTSTFIVSNRKRTCQWLSIRPSNNAATLCLRSDISSACPVTCRSCPS